MAQPKKFQRYNIGDKVYITGMVSMYRITEVDYDVRRAEFKYSLEGHPSWVFEHVITKTGGDKVAASVTDRPSPGKFNIGQEVNLRGMRDETFIVREWRKEAPTAENQYGRMNYKLSDEKWYNEEMLYVDMWARPEAVPKVVRPKIKVGDVVQCIDSGNQTTTTGGGAYRKGRYYLVSKVTEDGTALSTALDSMGTVGNGWATKKFKKMHTGPAELFGDGLYMCVEDVNEEFTKGNMYQHTGKDGCLMGDNSYAKIISRTHYHHFVNILVKKDSEDDGWNDSDELPGKSQDASADNKDDWDEADEVIPVWTKPVEAELLDVDIKTEMKYMFPMQILIEGPVGVGKSTLVMELAKELGLEYFASVLTEGTSKNEFTGYKNVMNGDYIGGEFRRCFEFGGLFNLEELNATTANLPIIFNTITNGYFVFADKQINAHPDFRLVATMNEITNAKDFGGRRPLDKSVKDRFHIINMTGDIEGRFSPATVSYSKAINTLLSDKGISYKVSQRDMQRFDKIKKHIGVPLAIKKCFVKEMIEISDNELINIAKVGEQWDTD